MRRSRDRTGGEDDLPSEGMGPGTDDDPVATDYDDLREELEGPAEERAEKLASLAGMTEQDRVLDVGCGTSRISRALGLITGARVVGLDISASMIAQGTAAGSPGDPPCIVRGDAGDLPFADQVFDTVLLHLILHQVKDVPGVLTESGRVLAPGGKILVATLSGEQIGAGLLSRFPGVMERDLERFPTIGEVTEALKERGMGRITVEVLGGRERRVPVEPYLSFVARRPISTLHLMTEGEWRRGFEEFEALIRKEFGEEVVERNELTIILAGRE